MNSCKCTDPTCPVHPGTVCDADASEKIAKVDFCKACTDRSFSENRMAVEI